MREPLAQSHHHTGVCQVMKHVSGADDASSRKLQKVAEHSLLLSLVSAAAAGAVEVAVVSYTQRGPRRY